MYELKTGAPVDLLEVGCYLPAKKTSGSSSVLARVKDNGAVEYFYSKDGQIVELSEGASDLYPNEGTITHGGGKGPFALIAPRTWPTTKKDRTQARIFTRARLHFLVRFAHILTEHVTSIPGKGPYDLLLQLKELCKQLH